LARNTKNGKVYVGTTKRSLAERIEDHCEDYQLDSQLNYKPLFIALQLYGFEAFTWEVLAEYKINREALDAERVAILAHRSNEPEFGYNIRVGHLPTPESRQWSAKGGRARRGKGGLQLAKRRLQLAKRERTIPHTAALWLNSVLPGSCYERPDGKWLWTSPSRR
jgi:hypothetical protein